MSTNKTRLVIMDRYSADPATITGVLEFDIYQEAVDYARTVAFRSGVDTLTSYATWVYVYSYDNTSYQIVWDGSVLQMNEISFPY
jgi:hypothetical protein